MINLDDDIPRLFSYRSYTSDILLALTNLALHLVATFRRRAFYTSDIAHINYGTCNMYRKNQSICLGAIYEQKIEILNILFN